MKRKIAIIGGGAAGFFAAANLDSSLYDISIFEQNTDVLQKVKISGGGRCNVTHACFDPKELVRFYPRGNKELVSVFSKFQPGDTMAWFEEHGVPLKIETDGRVFPESNSSQSIIDALYSNALKKGIAVNTKVSVKDIIPKEEGYIVETSKGEFLADIIIYTTGSSPKGMKLLAKLGHKMVSPVPSLFTFNVKDELLDGLSGTSFPDVEVKIPNLKSSENGALLITHWGLSGPAVLKLSAWEAVRLAEVDYQFDVEINFLNITYQEAESYFLDFKEKHSKKTIGQSKIFPTTQRFWNRVLELNRVNKDKQLANISSKEMGMILETLCRKLFRVNGKSTFKEEFVTAGGVDLKEINFKTMASKCLSNFYIAGEVLNIDAVTGGFNFQACWSEAYLISEALNSKSYHEKEGA